MSNFILIGDISALGLQVYVRDVIGGVVIHQHFRDSYHQVITLEESDLDELIELLNKARAKK